MRPFTTQRLSSLQTQSGTYAAYSAKQQSMVRGWLAGWLWLLFAERLVVRLIASLLAINQLAAAC
jgi:hypothetical protein